MLAMNTLIGFANLTLFIGNKTTVVTISSYLNCFQCVFSNLYCERNYKNRLNSRESTDYPPLDEATQLGRFNG